MHLASKGIYGEGWSLLRTSPEELLLKVALRQRYDETGKTDVPADVFRLHLGHAGPAIETCSIFAQVRNGQRARAEHATPVKAGIIATSLCVTDFRTLARLLGRKRC